MTRPVTHRKQSLRQFFYRICPDSNSNPLFFLSTSIVPYSPPNTNFPDSNLNPSFQSDTNQIIKHNLFLHLTPKAPQIIVFAEILKETKMKSGNPKKKSKKRNTLHNYYAHVLNFQGFPKHLCRYEDTIKDHVYVPKKYLEAAKPSCLDTFCPQCKLTPCFSHFHYKEMCQKVSSIVVENKGTALVATKRCETLMKGHMRRYFGAKYTREVGLPECFYEALHSIISFFESTRACSIPGCPCGQNRDSPTIMACLSVDAAPRDLQPEPEQSPARAVDEGYATQEEQTHAHTDASEEGSDDEFEF